MPLVTRSSEQGNLFKQALEPGGWLEGDLWSDTTANVLKLNVSGTAEEIGGLDISNIAVRHSIAQSVATTIAPAAAEHHEFNFYVESAPAGTTLSSISVNGTNDIACYDMNGVSNVVPLFYIQASNPAGAILINDAGDFIFTTPATVGTYIFQRIGQILS